MTRRPLLLLAAILLALLVAAFVLWLWVGLLRDLSQVSVPVGLTPTPSDAAPTVASRGFARSVLPASPDPAADQPAARAQPSPSASRASGSQMRSVAAVPPAPSASAGEAGQEDSSVWDRLAFCESRGQWHINTGNGYYGGLQENMDFWRSYGDPTYARPDLAPKSAQIEAAVKARDGGRGYEPWPQCSVKVELR